MTGYPRDLVGYADQPPDPRWPGGARLALNFVVNYEEGGERSVLHGDKVAETRLTDLLLLTEFLKLNQNISKIRARTRLRARPEAMGETRRFRPFAQ